MSSITTEMQLAWNRATSDVPDQKLRERVVDILQKKTRQQKDEVQVYHANVDRILESVGERLRETKQVRDDEIVRLRDELWRQESMAEQLLTEREELEDAQRIQVHALEHKVRDLEAYQQRLTDRIDRLQAAYDQRLLHESRARIHSSSPSPASTLQTELSVEQQLAAQQQVFVGRIMPLLELGVMPLSYARDFDLVITAVTTGKLPPPFNTDRRVCGIAHNVQIRQLKPTSIEHTIDFVIIEDELLSRAQSPSTTMITEQHHQDAVSVGIWLPRIQGYTSSTLKFSFVRQVRTAACC